MNTSLTLFALVSIIIFTLLLPDHALAEGSNFNFGDFESDIIEGSIDQFVARNRGGGFLALTNLLVNFTVGFIVLIGVIVIVAAGYMYMTAGGDASRVASAKTLLISSLSAMAIALASVVILNVINPKLGSDAEEPQLSVPDQPAQRSGGNTPPRRGGLPPTPPISCSSAAQCPPGNLCQDEVCYRPPY